MRLSAIIRAAFVLALCIHSAACAGDEPEPVEGQIASLASNFRIRIDGLDTSKITKVEGIGFSSQPAKGGPATLLLHVPAADAQPFVDWLEAAKLAPPGRRNGKVDAGGATWSLTGLEIRKVSHKDSASQIVVEVYLEQYTLA